MAIELKNRLAANLELTLYATLLFDYPTIEALTDYLASQLLSSSTQVEPEPDEMDWDEELGDISELEIKSLLLEELEKMDL